MKTRMAFLASALLLAVSVSAATKVSENRKLSGFEEIEVSGSPTVVYAQGTTFSVKVEGDQESIADIITTVQGKTLTVKNKGKHGIFNITTGFGRSKEAVVYVTSPDLVEVRVSGSGSFISKTKVDTDVLKLVLRGSGDIKFKDVICDRCKIDLVGSGDLDMDRLEAQTATATLTGSGDIDLGLLNVNDTHLTLKGSGDIDANFLQGCRSVVCELQGSGDITLKGKVRSLSKQKRGSGDIDTGKLQVVK